MKQASLNSLTFAVDGMHCIRCVQKVREITRNVCPVEELKIDLGRREVSLKASENFDQDGFVKTLASQGFKARLMSQSEIQSRGTSSSQKKMLARLGVAGACAGNIMIVSAALYAGAEETNLGPLLRWLSFLLFVPALFYSAFPFFNNSWQAVSSRRASVDIPIALALVGGTGLGLYNLIRGGSEIYFDSLAILVFLILATRYMVLRLQSNYLSPISVSDILGARRIHRKKGGLIEPVGRDDIQVGDHIVLAQGDFVPVDGRLLGEKVEVDNSFLTGESLPQLFPLGVEIYS